MTEFSKAKKDRENFVPHNDKAIKLVDRLLESKDTKDRTRESFDRIVTALSEIKDTEKKDSLLNSLVLQLAHSRDNNLIKQFLEHISKESREYGTKAFHAFVLKLTCNDDWNTLDTVLDYGIRNGEEGNLTPEIPGGNPIAIASEQVSHISVKESFNAKLC